MRIRLNGTDVELAGAPSVIDAIGLAGHTGAFFGIAVAINGEVITKSGWADAQLSEGDKVEVLIAAQGG